MMSEADAGVEALAGQRATGIQPLLSKNRLALITFTLQ